MKRRSFLSLLTAAIASPALPVSGRAATAAVGYNRYTYGYAVFHARHGGAFGAAELATSMKVSVAQAKGMIAEMAQSGVVRATTNGAVEAVTTHGGRKGGIGFLRKATETANELLDRIASAETPEPLKSASDTAEIHADVLPTQRRRDADTENLPKTGAKFDPEIEHTPQGEIRKGGPTDGQI